MRTVQWNGLEYPTIVAAAQACGITASAMRLRLKAGYRSDAEMDKYAKRRGIGKSVIWNGRQYPSIVLAAEACSISPVSMRLRLKAGYTSDAEIEQSARHRGRAVIWNGVEYPSIMEAAEACGISSAAMQQRLKAGYASDEAMQKATQLKQRAVIWNGLEYSSIREAAEACGIASAAMRQRLKAGYSADSEMHLPNHRYRPQGLVWNGIAYASVQEAAQACGISPSSMNKRLKKGYTSDEAMRQQRQAKHQERKSRTLVWNGVEYASIAEAAQACGATVKAMYKRLAKGQVSDEDLKRGKRVSWNGLEYASITEAAQACAVSLHVMRQRLQAGYTSDAEMPQVRPQRRQASQQERKGKTVVWNGLEYPSITAAAQACGIQAVAMSRRLQRGYTSDAEMHRRRPQQRRREGRRAGKGKSVIWNGLEYPSVRAAAQACGIQAAAMSRRLRRGYTSDAEMLQGRRQHHHREGRGKAVEWNELEYPSISAAAQACGIQAAAMSRRLRRGYTSDADLHQRKPQRQRRGGAGKVAIWNGLEYPSISAAAQACGISREAMRLRLKAGYSSDADMSKSKVRNDLE